MSSQRAPAEVLGTEAGRQVTATHPAGAARSHGCPSSSPRDGRMPHTAGGLRRTTADAPNTRIAPRN